MEKEPYVYVFDNYLPEARTVDKLIATDFSYENIITTSKSLYDKLAPYFQNTNSEYESFLDYIKLYLFRPNMFVALPNKLIGLRHSIIIFSGPEDFFNYFVSLSSNVFDYEISFKSKYFRELYDLHYSFLKTYADIPYPYNNYIANVYKTTISCPQLYSIFMNHSLAFCYINKELCLFDPFYKDKGFGLDVMPMLKRYITDVSPSLKKYIFDESEKSLFPPSRLVPLLNTLPKIVNRTSFFTSAPCCSSNYSFNFIAKMTLYYAYFSDQGIQFTNNTNQNMPTIMSINLDEFDQINRSQNWGDVLYAVTGGIKQNIDNISIICALIMTNYYKNTRYTIPSKNCSPISLYIVYASKDQTELIRHFLDKTIPHYLDQTDYQLKDITKRKNILDLIMNNFYTPAYIPVRPSKSRETEKQINTIKKIIGRKEITVKDDDGLNHTFINHLPAICFVDDTNQLNWLQANFKTKTFTFQPTPSQSFDEYDLQNCAPLSGFLSIYGLKLLYDSNFKNDSNIKWQEQSENITENFINDCLKSEDDHIIYADKLYEIYTNYFKLFCGESPLTKICFTKELRKLLSAKSIPYQYKKPRHSRADNRYAFVGINIDIEKAKEAANRTGDMRKDARIAAFNDYLNDMQKSVNEILQSLCDCLYKK